VAEVARQVAELRGLDVEQVGEQTTENFKRLFKIGS
jgi:Tat protein secretion system quality control protein TatD with DNase activity